MALDELPPSVGLGGADALPMFLEEQDDGWRVGPEASVTLDKVRSRHGTPVAGRSPSGCSVSPVTGRAAGAFAAL